MSQNSQNHFMNFAAFAARFLKLKSTFVKMLHHRYLTVLNPLTPSVHLKNINT